MKTPAEKVNEIMKKYMNKEITRNEALTLLEFPEAHNILSERELDRHTAYTDKK